MLKVMAFCHLQKCKDANKVGKNETKVVIPLKHVNNVWNGLNIPLIN